jgi:hypothetical protein
MAKNFIAGAIKHPGALTAAAKAAGQTNAQWAQAHKNDPGKAGDRARFYFVLQGVRPGAKKKG